MKYYRVTNRLIILLALGILNSCVTPEEKRIALQNERFSPHILANLAKYKRLHTLISANFESIITYRDYLRWEEELPKESCYGMIMDYKSDKYEKVPTHLRQELNELYHSMGEKLSGMVVCRDSSITIGVFGRHVNDYLTIHHSLIWNSKVLKDDPFAKDTLIDKNCIYRITLTESYD